MAQRFIFLLMCLVTVSGCQIYYTDPYSGHYDPSRTLRTEGFISALYHSLAKRKIHPNVREPVGTHQNYSCGELGRSQRKQLNGLVRAFSDYGHPAVRVEARGGFFYVYLAVLQSPESEEHLTPEFYTVLEAVGHRLSTFGRMRWVLTLPELVGSDGDDQAQLVMQWGQQIVGQLSRYGINPLLGVRPIGGGDEINMPGG
jgi:hypothetical protein